MLELEGISVGYVGRYLIPKVNLTFEPGKIYGIVGKNGSGKTGLLKFCAGLEMPESGSVKLTGREIGNMTLQDLRRRVGYFPQDWKIPSLNARQVVGRSLPNATGLGKVTQEQRRRVYECLTAVQAAGLGQLPMSKLSRGECRRIFMAALLAHDPDVFLLDEPFADLDVENRLLLVHVIQRLKAEGKIVIFATQDVTQAMSTCDEMIAIDAGREIYTGTPEQISKDGILDKIFKLG